MLEDRLVNMQVVPDYLQQDFYTYHAERLSLSIAPIVEGEHVEAVNVHAGRVCLHPKLMNIRLVCWSIVGRGPASGEENRHQRAPGLSRSALPSGREHAQMIRLLPCRVVYGNAPEKRHGRDARSGPLSGIGRI